MNKYRWSMLFGTGQFKVRSGSLPAPFRGIYAEQMNLSDKKAGYKEKQKNPKCVFHANSDAFTGRSVHVSRPTFIYSTGSTCRSCKSQDNVKYNPYPNQLEYGEKPFPEGRRERITVAIQNQFFHPCLMRLVPACHGIVHSCRLYFICSLYTITQKGQMSNVFCS